MVKARLLYGYGDFKVEEFGGIYPVGYSTYCDGSCPDVIDERLFDTYEEASKHDLGLSRYRCSYDIFSVNGVKYVSAREYLVEYVEVDEDGEFLSCIGCDTAPVEGSDLSRGGFDID